MATKMIPNEVLELLREGTIDGNVFILHESRQLKGDNPLPRPLYQSFNKVMTVLGGKWNRGKNGHVFPDSPGDAIADALENGEVTDTKKELQQFYTPRALAVQMAQLASGRKRILEPSAGEGALAASLLDYVPGCTVDAIEIDPVNCAKLGLLDPSRTTVHESDFLDYRPAEPYDAIVMNPPFTKGQDVDHVTHALGMLAFDGILVAIMSPGYQFRATKKFREFRGLIDTITQETEDIPEGTFRGAGTNVRTVLLVLKPALDPAWGPPATIVEEAVCG